MKSSHTRDGSEKKLAGCPSLRDNARTQHLERLSEPKGLTVKVHQPLVGFGSFLTHGDGSTRLLERGS
jgi:hypothetical protein